jgi:AraC-like DNA-binding protein
MAKGNSWKTRQYNRRLYHDEPRKILKRELKEEPQFKFDDLYTPPFTKKKRYDEDGHWKYVALEKNSAPTGIRVMDEYLEQLAAGNFDIVGFATKLGLKSDEINALVLILTGIKGVRFRQLYQLRVADDLLRYTDMTPAQVARRSGHGSQNNFYLALRREYDMSATERRQFLRRNGDLGRYA